MSRESDINFEIVGDGKPDRSSGERPETSTLLPALPGTCPLQTSNKLLCIAVSLILPVPAAQSL